jgi:hypothetical protein
MPGTGHSARYKGSISNRVQISPFEQLAKWNAQLLGAEGAIPTITGGGGSLEFKKLDASDIDGVMTNPASTAGGGNLDMASFGISKIGTLADVSTISNGGAMTISTSSGSLFLTSANEIQLQPTSGAGIVLECASTNGEGDILLRWPDAGLDHVIKIGFNNTQGGTKQVHVMADTFSAGTNSLHMGSGSLQLATLDSLQTTISGGNTMAISGPTITVGGGGTATNLTIGNTTGATVTTIKGGGAGVGTGSINIGNTIAETVNIGHSSGELGFFGVTAIPRPQCNMLVSSSEGTGASATLDQVINRINYIIRIMDEGGDGSAGNPDGLGLWKNTGGQYDNDDGF